MSTRDLAIAIIDRIATEALFKVHVKALGPWHAESEWSEDTPERIADLLDTHSRPCSCGADWNDPGHEADVREYEPPHVAAMKDAQQWIEGGR